MFIVDVGYYGESIGGGGGYHPPLKSVTPKRFYYLYFFLYFIFCLFYAAQGKSCLSAWLIFAAIIITDEATYNTHSFFLSKNYKPQV